MKQTKDGLRYYEPKDKGRKFCFILWPDSSDYDCQEVLTRLQVWATCSNFAALWILHDKDVDENGELKKAHYHVLLKFENSHSCESVEKHLGLNHEKPILVQYDSFDDTLLYFLHYENGGK